MGIGPELGINFKNAASPHLPGSHAPRARNKLEYSGFIILGSKLSSLIEVSIKMNMDFIAPDKFELTDDIGNKVGKSGFYNRYAILSFGYQL